MGLWDPWRHIEGENLRQSQKTAFFWKSNSANGKTSFTKIFYFWKWEKIWPSFFLYVLPRCSAYREITKIPISKHILALIFSFTSKSWFWEKHVFFAKICVFSEITTIICKNSLNVVILVLHWQLPMYKLYKKPKLGDIEQFGSKKMTIF